MDPNNRSRADYLAGNEIPGSMFGSRKVIIQLAVLIAIGFTGWVWFGVFATQKIASTAYFLDIGQGDSQLIVLAPEQGGPPVKILIDGGPGRTVLDALDEALPALNNKYIDIVLLTHTDLDHLSGIVEVVRRYDIGLFVSNGRESDSDAFKELKQVLASRHIPVQTLIERDIIRYGKNTFTILSPDPTLLKNRAVNEAGIVAMLDTGVTRALYTADTGFIVEDALLRKGYDLKADILKVGHHGSKYSSGENFIAAVRPTVSVIEVGKKNTYGHPTPRVLQTLELAGSRMYRTDESGTIRVPLNKDESSEKRADANNSGFMASVVSILSGGYKKETLTTVSLSEAKEESGTFKLIPFKLCSFSSPGSPKHSPMLINEIAWMGSSGGSTHEWVELKNVSGETVNVSGWQLLNENEKIHITFPQGFTSEKQFTVLARAAANDALGLNADITFTGSIRNSNEGLRLFDNNCNLIDEVFASPSWPAGDNKSKRTMERTGGTAWATSEKVGGTPGR